MTENPGMELDASWTGVLMDVGKRRKDLEEHGVAYDRPDGMLPDEMRKSMLDASLVALQADPSWGTCITVQSTLVRFSKTEDEIRNELLDLAAMAVAWIEALDRRSKNPAKPVAV